MSTSTFSNLTCSNRWTKLIRLGTSLSKRFLLNLKTQLLTKPPGSPSSTTKSWILAFLALEITAKSGKSLFRDVSPIHTSSQNRIRSPFPTLKLTSSK
uniref:Uncharacterized protein n=1 Tax=Cannabis sativa TaxID=3483 RepID=A0A803QWC3_CANSA